VGGCEQAISVSDFPKRVALEKSLGMLQKKGAEKNCWKFFPHSFEGCMISLFSGLGFFALAALGAALIGVDVCKHCLDIVTVFETAFLFSADECRRHLVIPTAFGHEGVPDFHLLIAGRGAFLVAPLEHLLIRAALESSGLDGIVVDSKKGRGSLIESCAKVGMQVRVQLAGGHESDFIQHSA
jgi:hypothetical protein